MNLIVCKHSLSNTKPYLFQAPEDTEIGPMVDLLVDTKMGKSVPATSITPSFEVPDYQLRSVCAAYGTKPECLQPVVGFRFEIAVHFDDERACRFWARVMSDWEDYSSADDCDEDCADCPYAEEEYGSGL